MSKAEDTKKPRGGRPSLPLEKRRSERISFGATKAQKATFLVNAANAGLSSNDYARAVLCTQSGHRDPPISRAADFELVDALSRIGADLARLQHIADQTGVVPGELSSVISRLERKLDHLIVGSRMADELSQHRNALVSIGRKLDDGDAMTPKARRMITTFDAVVTKVLSA